MKNSHAIFQVLFLCLLDKYRECSREHQGPEDDVGTEQKKPGSLKDYMESHSINTHHELSCGQQTSTVKLTEILESSLQQLVWLSPSDTIPLFLHLI